MNSKSEKATIERHSISISYDELRMILLREAANEKLLDKSFVLTPEEITKQEDLVKLHFIIDQKTNTISEILLVREKVVSVDPVIPTVN